MTHFKNKLVLCLLLFATIFFQSCNDESKEESIEFSPNEINTTPHVYKGKTYELSSYTDKKGIEKFIENEQYFLFENILKDEKIVHVDYYRSNGLNIYYFDSQVELENYFRDLNKNAIIRFNESSKRNREIVDHTIYFTFYDGPNYSRKFFSHELGLAQIFEEGVEEGFNFSGRFSRANDKVSSVSFYNASHLLNVRITMYKDHNFSGYRRFIYLDPESWYKSSLSIDYYSHDSNGRPWPSGTVKGDWNRMDNTLSSMRFKADFEY
ncbi:hypothetical protein [Reichenbachiella versicolor]|uniref:hypothetical protein n=1 Tax=Reichenbachiella versicolor TaxID=1821036 RepID=UPI0013A55060|nr:hypothetical protein [Reichenbachiella versicolor]